MILVHILVEGQTEETFVNKVLYPHLLTKEIYITPSLVSTKKVNSGPNFKGGLGSYGKVKHEIFNLLRNSSISVLTTMFDFYGLPTDFPSFSQIPTGNCYSKVEFLERAFQLDIANSKFLPYFALHEFESILFVGPSEICSEFSGKSKEGKVLEIKNGFHNSPEEINNNPNTAPSKRIKDLFPSYQKTLHGPLITDRIGIDRIRAECPHFNDWLTKLESL